MGEIVLGFFSASPAFVKTLMGVRNAAVSMLGLKTGGPPPIVGIDDIYPGNRIGLFTIGKISADSAVLGADDSHLNFRVCFILRPGQLTCETCVQFNNRVGRTYFNLIRPFHRWVAPTVVKADVKKATSRKPPDAKNPNP